MRLVAPNNVWIDARLFLMESPATWEKIIVAILALFLVFAFRPGIKAALEQSRHAEKDWRAALIPIVLVVLFVIFLIAINR